jgi:membrane protease YdiL (CAAX protease family)
LFITAPENFPGKQGVFVAIQALSSMLLFIGGTYFFIKRENGLLFHSLTEERNTINHPFVLLVVPLVLLSIPTFSLLGELNEEAVKLLVGTEGLAQLLEIDAKTNALYDYLLGIKDVPVLLLSIVGIAIIPAVGEELVFRGVFQNLFKRVTENKHLAIWISAFIFSAIHLEFSNFVVRLLIGGLFGYLYDWTKNIYIPIVAHAVFNSFSLIIGYLLTNNYIDESWNESSLQSNAWLYVVLFSLLPIGLIYQFYKKTKADVV